MQLLLTKNVKCFIVCAACSARYAVSIINSHSHNISLPHFSIYHSKTASFSTLINAEEATKATKD